MRPTKRVRSLPLLAALALAGACTNVTDAPPGAGHGVPNIPIAGVANPGTPFDGHLPADQQAELDALLAEMKASEDMTAGELADLYEVPFSAGLGYDPTTALGLPLIQGSALALSPDELAALGANGLVISEQKRFPTFVYGYEAIYAQDLPLFVSADSILFAVHRSYDEILKAVEVASLLPELSDMLDEMRSSLAAGGAAALGAQARADADVFLAVAESLLADSLAAPVAGGDAALIGALVNGAKAASGARDVTLFGTNRTIDFSQFKPRGHYTDSPELERYFRAMMWLGRIDFRMLEAQPDHSLVFRRRQLEGALALRELIGEATRSRWIRIDAAIQAFVGEADYMVLPELDGLLADLGASSAADLAAIPDAVIGQAILDGGYGTQRISSHIMVNGLGEATMPLSSSFALFGQRYVVDSHVFSNVVYDRVQGGSVLRMMPSPLDAAFAAFGNDQAGQLLDTELTKYGYAPDLHMMRVLVDAHPADYWTENLYNLWLSSLRTLSPGDEVSQWAAVGLPSIAATEPWGRRLLSTQLASWAELRHDTILYAKQSYTGGSTCEFPDAYVEPYPAFFASIASLAERGEGLVAGLDLSASPWLAQKIPSYFAELKAVAGTLQSMAEHQRTGTPFTAEQMAFINQAVAVQMGCGDPEGAEGWYANLFFDAYNSVQFDPTIADVHTQPTDEVGNPVGRVLHVGTGSPRLLVVTAETCTGPRAYVGLASSYFERVTEDFERLDDPAWSDELESATPPDVPWMTDLVVR
ncbi:MAG: DUF3160 domain-containing protein [Polyangiaceae bacterium]|nr:DUF3160 domain-containing protein [Polyangiaceae bacterium]